MTSVTRIFQIRHVKDDTNGVVPRLWPHRYVLLSRIGSISYQLGYDPVLIRGANIVVPDLLVISPEVAGSAEILLPWTVNSLAHAESFARHALPFNW